MSKPREFQNMSPEDQLTFNRWIRANAVVGSIFAVGMLAMALIGGSNPVGHAGTVTAGSSNYSNVATSE